jgi:O-ureido-D-serine cyclo-ligase
VSARVTIVSCRAARGRDEDEALLAAALSNEGAEVAVVSWDEDPMDYATCGLALLRSPWDYTERLPDFLDWAARVSGRTRLENPLPFVRWTTDKHYLADLARALDPIHPAPTGTLPADGPVIPGTFLEPGDDLEPVLDPWLAAQTTAQVVVKPTVGAGSREVERHERGALPAIRAHIERLHTLGRSVLVQPYLPRVDREGETALIYIEGVFSHAVRKGALLPARGPATADLFAREDITRRLPAADELTLGHQVMAVLTRVPALRGTRMPLYARVDLIRDDSGHPRLLELELCEPSLFLAHASHALPRFAAAVLARATAAAAGGGLR